MTPALYERSLLEDLAPLEGPNATRDLSAADPTEPNSYRLAFADPAARARLESVLHPMIRREAELACEASGAPYVVLVVPLLVETGAYRQRVDRVLVVDCDEAIQVDRVVARSGLTPEEVRAIMASQLPRAARLAAADDVISNAGGREALEPQVLALHRNYLRLRYDDGYGNG